MQAIKDGGMSNRILLQDQIEKSDLEVVNQSANKII